MSWWKMCSLWVVLSVGPLFVGSWWEAHFHVLQCAVAFILILAVLKTHDKFLIPVLGTLFTLQIIYNISDYFVDWPEQNYSNITKIISLIEFVVLFGVGGIAQFIRWRHGRNNARPNVDDGSRDAKRSSQGKAEIA